MIRQTPPDGCIDVDFERCQQCGACIAVCPTGALDYVRGHDGLLRIKVDHDKCVRCLRCLRVCPSAKPAVDVARYFDGIENRKYFLGHNSDPEIRVRSSSGGVCRTLVVVSLSLGLVDGVYTLRQSDKYPMAEGEFFTKEKMPDYDTMPNSVYHSVAQCLELAKVNRCRRLMIVGTSCQLRALSEALKGKFESLIRVCIFCKQQKTLDSTRFIAKVSGCRIPDNLQFGVRYRGCGWPGTVEINGRKMPWSRAAQVGFGRRLWTVPGCNVCGDPFGFEAGADLTLMDPWNIAGDYEGDTLITVNSASGLELLGQIPGLTLERKTFKDVAPALDLTDVRRKQALVPYFRGEKCPARVRWAGRVEQLQRKMLRRIISLMPPKPFVLYRILCKLPDLRNIILRK